MDNDQEKILAEMEARGLVVLPKRTTEPPFQGPTVPNRGELASEMILEDRGGHPVAGLRPVPTTQPDPRPFGLCAGALTVPNDFDAPLPEDVLRSFEEQ